MEEVTSYGSQESEGSTYRQLGFIAYRVGMNAAQRSSWYRIAREISLSVHHASHITGRLLDNQLEETRERRLRETDPDRLTNAQMP